MPPQYKAARFWIYSIKEASESELLSSIRAHQDLANLIAKGDAHGARNAMLMVMGSAPDRCDDRAAAAPRIRAEFAAGSKKAPRPRLEHFT